MLIKVSDPRGTAPAIQPRLLPNNKAQTAVNLELGNREVRPLGGLVTEATPYHGTDTKTIHPYNDVGGTLGALTQTAAAVGSTIRHTALSPNGRWLAVALTSTPFIAIYAVDGSAITTPTSPTGGDIPTGQGNWVAWAPDGDTIFMGHNTAPYLSAWPWDGTWGSIVNPGTDPGANVVGIAVSPDGGYVAAVTGTTPYLSIYPWTGAFGTLVQPAGDNIPVGAANGVVFDRTSKWVIAAHTTTPFVSAWKWDGDALGVIVNPDNLATGNGTSISISPDNLYVAITQTATPYVRAWRIDALAETQPFEYLLEDPPSADLPSSQPGVISWDRRGGFIFIGISGSPYMEGYAWNYGGWGRKLGDPDSLPGAEVLGFGSTDTGDFLYACFSSTTGLAATNRESSQWFDWDERVKCFPGPVPNDYRNRRFFTGDGIPKKTGNDIALPGTGTPPKLPADWYHLGVKAPAKLESDNLGDVINAAGTIHALGIAWSPNGKYLAAISASAPYIVVWNFTDPTNPGKLPDPVVTPGSVKSISWSPDGDFLAAAHWITPFVTVYPFTKDGLGTKVADPTPTLPAGNANGVMFSPDGGHIAVAHYISPYITAYLWTGTFGAKVTDPSTLPAGTANDVVFSPDGGSIAVAHAITPFISAYPWSAGTFGAKAADPSTLLTDDAVIVVFSPDTSFIAIGQISSPWIFVYPWDGTFGTIIANPSPLPSGQMRGIAFSMNGDYIALSFVSVPYFNVYRWVGKTAVEQDEKEQEQLPKSKGAYKIRWGQGVKGNSPPPSLIRKKSVAEDLAVGFGEKVPNPKTLPTGIGHAVAFSPDGDFLGVAHQTTPYITIYPWYSSPADRPYVITHVTGWGEESAPGNPEIIEEELLRFPRLTFPVEVLSKQNITHRRLYRVAVGAADAGFLFVKEFPISGTEFTDHTQERLLGDPLVTIDWDTPPDDLEGLTPVQGGFMAGFSNKVICFSEPYAPYAWPIPYRRALSYNPQAIGVIGSSVVVATDGDPEIFDGKHPRAMAHSVMEANQSCVNPESMVKVAGGVAYASPDGLFFVTGGSFENVTSEVDGGQPLMSKKDWQALSPGTMIGAVYDGHYYGFYDSGAGVFKAIVLNMRNKEVGILNIEAASGSLAEVAFTDLVSDTLYLVVGGVIKKWDADAGNPLTSTWKSKVFAADRPLTLSVLQVRATYPGTVTVKIYSDGVLRDTKAVTSAKAIRCDSGDRASEFEIEVSSTIPWKEITLASNMEELKASQ